MKRLLLSLVIIFSLFCSPSLAGIDFDGTDDYVDTNVGYNFGANDSFAFSMWVKFNSFPGAGVEWNIFGALTGTGGLQIAQLTLLSSLTTNGDKRPCFLVWGAGAGTYDTACWTSDLSTGVWYHIVCNYIDDAGLAIWVDGVEAGYSNPNSNNRAKNLSDADMLIGARNNGATPDTFVDAEITDFAIWRTSLGSGGVSQRIANLGSKLKGLPLQTGPSLLNYFPMNDQPVGTSADGDTVKDIFGGASGTGVDGANNVGLSWSTENLNYPSGVLQ